MKNLKRLLEKICFLLEFDLLPLWLGIKRVTIHQKHLEEVIIRQVFLRRKTNSY